MKKPAKRGTGNLKPPDDAEQSKRFEETARELGADENAIDFKKAIDKALPVKSVGRRHRPP